MSRLARAVRTRWPIAALLAGSCVALILTLVPSRAEALTDDGYCSVIGFFLCYRPEIAINSAGILEVRMFFNSGVWHPSPWIF